MNNEEQVAFERLVLQKIKLAATASISKDCLHDVLGNAEFKLAAGWMADILVGKMTSYVLGMNEQRITARWPADWWQAVRRRFAPGWCLRRWPVRYSGIDEPQFESVYLSLHGDRITPDPARGVK